MGDLHVFDDISGSGNGKYDILLLLERPGLVQNLLDLLYERAILLGLFRTVFLMVAEDFNLMWENCHCPYEQRRI